MSKDKMVFFDTNTLDCIVLDKSVDSNVVVSSSQICPIKDGDGSEGINTELLVIILIIAVALLIRDW